MAINVLMLGWELPPHNSGGLGTACLGLTEGLAEQDVQINFVVPKVFSKLPFSHMQVLSAVEYGGADSLKKILAQENLKPEDVLNQLAYGATISTDAKQQLLIEHLNQNRPVAPHVQAHWYAEQASAIAKHHDDFEVVHSHDWFTYYGGMSARQVAQEKGRATPFVAHVHATEIDRSSEHGDPRILEIERRGLQAADQVVAVSHYTKELVHRYYDVPRQKISVVHNGINHTRQPKRFDFQELKRHHKIVLFMGRLTMQKGPDYFVKLAQAVNKVDPSVRFVMVGSGDMEKRCIEESARLGLTGTMLFSSFLRGEDVDRAYQLADLFVMPSISEPFGIVALEAMQNGTPAIVSRQSGVAEVSEHVVKVDFWDIEKMRDAVLDVLGNPDYQHHLRQGAFQDLHQLTWQEAARKMRAIYEEALHNSLTSLSPSTSTLSPVSVSA